MFDWVEVFLEKFWKDLYKFAYTRCVLFLDIDGVLNSLGKIDDPVIIKHEWGTWQLTKENADFLRELSRIRHLKIVWSSTWGKESNEINRFLGIDDFSYISIKENKTKSIYNYIRKRKYLINGRKYLIVDDEDLGLCEYHVNGDTGLTEKDREQIRSWYNEN